VGRSEFGVGGIEPRRFERDPFRRHTAVEQAHDVARHLAQLSLEHGVLERSPQPRHFNRRIGRGDVELHLAVAQP
jgi:hypothetical protein